MGNKAIALEVKDQLLYNVELKNYVRSQAQGKFSVFVRNGEAQKISWTAFTLNSEMFLNDDEDDYTDIELPSEVYRRFCILLAEYLKDMPISMEYGQLNCEWQFTEENGNWKDVFVLNFDKEISIRNTKAKVAISN